MDRNKPRTEKNGKLYVRGSPRRVFTIAKRKENTNFWLGYKSTLKTTNASKVGNPEAGVAEEKLVSDIFSNAPKYTAFFAKNHC